MRALAVGAVVVAVAIAAVAASASPSREGASSKSCGEERWKVKTLTDAAEAAAVDVSHPKTTKVETLRHLNAKGKVSNGKPPKDLKKTTPRMPPVETTVYTVKAVLMSMRKEKDKDIHLVIADPKIGGSMIVEFPAPSCVMQADPARQADMQQAREALDSACGPLPASLSTVVTLQGKATISGVGFCDLVHGQGGVAPNGIELHPVLSFSSTSCSRVKP